MRRIAAIALLWTVGALPSATPQSAPRPAGTGNTMAAAPSAQIMPPSQNFRFPNGQTYVYGVEWHLFNAGTARVKIEKEGSEEHVTAIADSAGVVNLLYGVHDRFSAFFDPRTFCSQRVNKHSEEGSHKRDTEVRFDYLRRKSTLDEKNLKTGELKHEENDIPTCLTDVVSGFYYLSSLSLDPGGIHRFPTSAGGKTAEVEARVEGREQIKVPAGTFQTARVQAEATTGSLKGKGTLSIWFTDDANHTPVQMRARLGWGTLIFRLQRVEKP
jgi:hypothetical protein